MTDTFTYTLQDELGGQSVGTVSIRVTGLNDGPTAVADGGVGFTVDRGHGRW